MPICECNNCGGKYYWEWEEAFYKHGFNGGDGQVQTWSVESVLIEAEYLVEVVGAGIHNAVISSIKKNGKELIPYDNPAYKVGYDNPREFFPEEIIKLLDQAL